MPRTNEAFAKAVRELVGKPDGRHSLQGARIKTGIDHDTLSRMRQGDVPRMDKVVDFARGFGLDVNEWLALAGYAPIQGSEQASGYSLFIQGAVALFREQRRDAVPLALLEEAAREMTPEQADESLKTLRRQLEDGTI